MTEIYLSLKDCLYKMKVYVRGCFGSIFSLKVFYFLNNFLVTEFFELKFATALTQAYLYKMHVCYMLSFCFIQHT